MSLRNVDNFARVAERLRARGFPVVEHAGWQTRTQPWPDGKQYRNGQLRDMDSTTSLGIHHTVDRGPADYPSLRVVRDGRPGLSGPLSQWGVGRSGTLHLIAAGLCWHAGTTWLERQDNWNSVGIEAANNGTGEPWLPAIMHGYFALVEELQAEFRIPTSYVEGHKEIAKPKGRKTDPSFDMGWFRNQLGRRLGPAGGSAVSGGAPALSFATVPDANDTSRRAPDLLPVLGQVDADTQSGWTSLAQQCLGIKVDGDFGPATAAAVLEQQRAYGLALDALIGPWTWVSFLADAGAIGQGDANGSPRLEVLQNLLGFRGVELDRSFGPGTDRRVRQVQRWANLRADGIVGEDTRAALTRG